MVRQCNVSARQCNGESGLVGSVIIIGIGKFPVETPIGARPNLGTQPRYQTLGDLWVEIVKMQRLTSCE